MNCPNSDCRNYCEAGKPRCNQCEIELRLPWEKPFTEMTVEERAERGRKLYELYEQGLDYSIGMCDWECQREFDRTPRGHEIAFTKRMLEFLPLLEQELICPPMQ